MDKTNIDEDRRFLKEVLHSLQIPGGVITERTAERVQKLLNLPVGISNWSSHITSDAIRTWLAKDAERRATLHHRREEDSLASSDPRAYNKGVFDCMNIVRRLEDAARSKHFNSDLALLEEIQDEFLTLLRRAESEEGRKSCGSGCGRDDCSAESRNLLSPRKEIHGAIAGRKEAGRQQPDLIPQRMGQTLHDRLMDLGQNFDVQLIFFASEEEFQQMQKAYSADQGWVIESPVWYKETSDGTINVRIAYRQVVQP